MAHKMRCLLLAAFTLVATREEEAPFNFSFFVGGTDRGDEGAWYWVDGTPMNMGLPYWGQTDGVHEPSGGEEQNCAELNKNNRYYIHDGECEKYAFALCQYGVVAKL
ncbi:C-type lectin domain family 4 member E-like isoform X2 [Panulirus ornatus]|uniref:C-type lectin domain family 4 member E-like isoform X2 n=1 Tax=Panulirus ornatus TaxID=150431 RepID=UPI003A85C4AE